MNLLLLTTSGDRADNAYGPDPYAGVRETLLPLTALDVGLLIGIPLLLAILFVV